jgi:hypothetical protein
MLRWVNSIRLRRPLVPPFAWRVGHVGLVALVGACGAGTPSSHTPGNFPPYGGHATELFDDGIEPDAVGLATDRASNPGADNSLRERAQVGDAVVRARVMTVDESTSRVWQLAFHTMEIIHKGSGSGMNQSSQPTPFDADFALQVEPTDPSAGIVNSMSNRLVGHTFVVYLRTFAHPDTTEDGDVHFHIAADSKEQIEAVRSAIMLGEVR